MITKVRLKNWKSHLDSEFGFVKGVNALVGINGAGKSSVLDGISFGLFGTFPNHSNRKVGLDDLIMSRPQQKDEAEIEVDFFSDGKRYSVLRKVKRGKGTVQAEIRENGNLIEVNPNNVTGHIERILQIDYPLFSKAVYSEQNNIDYFLTIPKGKRMQHIDRMLRLDRFELVRESSGSIKTSIETRRGEKIKLVSELKKGELEKKLQKSLEAISVSEEEKRRIEADLVVVEKEKEELGKTVAEFEKKERKLIEIEKRLEGLKSAYTEVMASLKEKEGFVKTFNREEMERNLETLKAEAGSAEAEIKSKRDVLEASRAHVAASNIEIRAITENIRELEKVGAKCPICESEIGLEKKKGLVESKEKRIAAIKEDLESFVKEVGKMKEQIGNLENELKRKNKETERFTYKLEEFEIVERLNNKSKILELDIERFGKEKDASRKEIEAIDIKNSKAELEEKVRKLGELRSTAFGLENSISREKELAEDLGNRIGLIERYETDIEISGKMVSLMDKFIQSLKMTQEQMREEFTKTVNYIMANIWNSLYPYNDFTDIRLAIDSGDYALEIKNMDSWVTVDGFASGGERSLACLALRIAFSLAFIPSLRWLILDEPTHNLDSNTIQKFSYVLKEQIGRFVNQIFLITHEGKVVEDIDGVIYKLERDKSANGITQVIKI